MLRLLNPTWRFSLDSICQRALSPHGKGDADFVSHFFAPANGVPEDVVSGLSHLCLAPYWADVAIEAQINLRDDPH
jgi:predicted PhzF superfamily epimerase YddE/YHI9